MPTNWIQNGTFGDTSDWSLFYGNGSSGVYIDTTAQDLVMDGLAWPDTQEANSNDFPTAAGVTYTVTFDLKEQNSGGGHSNTNFHMGLLQGIDSGPDAGLLFTFPGPGGITPTFDATWHTYSLSFVGTGAETYIEFNNAIGANEATIDNVSVTTSVPPVGLALANDTGTSDTDNITNVSTIVGVADPGSAVTLTRGASVLATLTSDASGLWTYSPSFADGTYTLTASETNTNSVTGTATLAFTLDTTPPAIPTAALASDTGASSSDHITSNPAVTGTAEAGDVITILVGGTTLDVETANSSGTWFSSPSLSDGFYALTIEAADTAGNVATTTLSLTLDTNPPSPSVGLVSDTGDSNSDGLTSDPAISGSAEAGDVVTIFNGGTTLGAVTANANGSWTYTPTLADGSYTLTASEADVAGNIGTSTVGFTLETVAQPVSIGLPDDTGLSPTDHITSDPTFSGSAEANSAISITNNGTVVGSTSADGSGSWNTTVSLPDGTYTLIVDAVNEAGNTATNTFSFQLETTAPPVTAVLTHDTGVSASDGVTSNPAMNGTAEAGSVISFINSEDSSVLGSVTTNASGTWSFAPTIGDGTYSLTVSEETIAGNIATTSLNLTLDTTVMTVSAALTDDDGASSSDGITSDPAIGGTTEPDSVVVIRNGSTVLGTVNADDSGTWSFTPSLADGTYTLTIGVSNLAGGSASTTLGFTLETTAPPVTIALVDDTGSSSSDRLTSNPALTGTAAPGSVITIIDDSDTTYGTVTAGVSGGWSFTPSLSDGTYNLTAIENTLAGNTATASLTITTDTTAPSVAASIVDVTDSGITTTDPAIAGTADANSVVTIAHGATVLGTATADGDGSWGFTLALPNGDYSLTVSETDSAGNIGTATTEITLEGQTVPLTAVLASDTGVSASDGITSDPAINGTAAADSVITIANGATVLGTVTADASGSWSFTPTLADGSYTLIAGEAIPGGGTGSGTLTFTLDTTAPVVTAALSDDTGVSNSDGITSIAALTGTADAGGHVTISNGATVLGTATAGVSGTWSFTPSLADGSYTLTAAETDAAGNTGSTTLALTLETSAPTPTIALVSDTGASSSDGITSNAALTGTAIAAGTVVLIRNGGTELGFVTAGVGGTWSFTPTLADGSYTLTALETDTAGNIGSTTLAVTLETSATPPTVALVSDTGASASDHITSSDALSGTAEAGSIVRIKHGGTVLGTATAGISGAWSFTPTLSDGGYVLTAQEETPAGNVASATLSLTLETTAIAPTAALVSDTGVSSSDGITSDPALIGTAEVGSVVTISNGATVLGTATTGVSGTWSFTPTLIDGSYTLTASELTPAGNTASTTLAITLETTAPPVVVALVADTGVSPSDGITSNPAIGGTAGSGSVVTLTNGATILGTVTANNSGSWSFTPTLADGTYTLTASELTRVGNTGSNTLSFTLDTTAPVVTAALLFDTGLSASDGITTNQALTGTADAGGLVTISNGATVLGTATAGVSGTWSSTPTLAAGSYTLTASETDAAGNTGTATLAMTLETSAPTLTATLFADTGASASDDVTSNPAITGTAGAGSIVRIRNGATVLGTVTAGDSGAWSFTPTLADGTYTLTALEQTVAGNVASTTLALTLETSAPAPTAALVSDTGVSASDHITANPAITGTAEAGSVVTISNGATVLGTATAGISGTWSFTPTLVDGGYTLTASELTLAGNTASTTLALTLEATAPTPTAVLVSDTGVSPSDGITSNPAITGTAAVGSVITVSNGATVLGTATAGVSSTWSFTPTLADGGYTLAASELTPAGNTASTTLALTLETTAVAPTEVLVSDTGVSSSDGITSNPALTGTAEAGSVVTINNGATVLGTTTAGVSGTWSFTPTLAGGSYTLTASEVTLAGNTASTTLALTLETAALVPTLALVSDTGISASDHITSNQALTGLAEAGSVVTIHNGATVLGTTTAGISGTWAFTPTLPGGSYTLTASETTLAGNTASSTLSLTLETTAPTPTAALVSDTGVSASDGVTSDPAVTGLAEAGSIVTIRNGATVLGTTTAGVSGTWSFTPTLADGGYTLTASELTLAGNTASTTLALTLVTSAAAPTAALVSDTGVSASDHITSDPAIIGTAAAGSVITIRNGATVLGTTTAGVSGSWGFTPTLADGSYTLTASETDIAGNIGATTLAITLEATAPTPTAVLVQDTGFSASDHITSDPAVTGTAAAGSVITVTNGATVLGTTTAGVSGTWSFTPTLADGGYTLTASELTPAGNTASTTLALTLDTTAVTPTAALVSDTGVSASDGITSNPALHGTAAAGSLVTISNGATVLGTVTAGVSGAWSFTPTLANGSYTLTALEQTLAGNTASTTLALTLEATAPTPTASLDADTGISASDHITADSAINGTAAAGSVITISNGATVLGTATADVSGGWSFSPTLADGSFTLTASELTPAGNTASTTLALTLETVAPTPTAVLVSDTGVSASDHITSDAAITGTAGAGSVITIVDDATVLGTVTAGVSGAWSFTPTLGDGSYTLTAFELTVAGNGASTTLAMTLETTAAAPTVVLVSDTGVSASDDITSNPALTGTAEAGSIVTIRDGVTVLGVATADVSGAWSFTPTLADGGYTLTASELTLAGNTASTTLDLTLETAAPDPTADLVSDTGPSSADGVTSDPDVTGTAVAGSVITISDDTTVLGTVTADVSGNWSFSPTLADGDYTLTASELTPAGNTASTMLGFTLETTAVTPTTALAVDTGVSASDEITSDPAMVGIAEPGSVVTIRNGVTVLGTATTGKGGNWSFTPTLADGTYTLTALEVTRAGNTASATLALTLETGAPTPTAVLVSDTGVSASDHITSNAAITGTAGAGSVITISDGATVLGTTTTGVSGTWGFTPTLVSGNYTLTASEHTLAGNVASTTLALTFEEPAPAPTETLVSDTGMSSSDRITSNSALTGTAAAGSVVTISNGATVLGTVTAGVSGTWSFTPTLADGGYTLTALELTQAGNTASTTLSLTLETTVATPAALTLATGSDSGVSGDHITNAVTPVIAGTGVAGDTIILYDGIVQIGTGTVVNNGTWSITSSSLTAGGHSLNATQTDTAGNVSGTSTALALTIDTTIPAQPTQPVLAPASDSGTLLDDITNINVPAITGGGTIGDTVTLFDGSTAIGSAVVGGGGTWSITTSLLSDGLHLLTAAETEVAGNTSAPSAPLILTIDTTAPAAPTLGESVATTDPAAPVIDGTAEAGSTVLLSQGNTTIGTVSAGSGTWSFDYQSALAAGSYTLTATATDSAGNMSAVSAPLTLRVNSDNSYAVVTPVPYTDTTKSYVYDSTGNLTTVQTNGGQNQLLTSVTDTQAVINIYDTDGNLIGTITQPSTSAFSLPVFATTPDTLAASTGSGPIGSVVDLLSETNNFVSQGNDTITVHSGTATITATGPSTVVNNDSANVTFWGGTGTATVNGGSGTVTAIGGAGGGTLTGGTAGNNILAAGGGITTVNGVANGDQLFGSNTGTDTLVAGAGIETLVGGAGTETLDANTGDAAFGGSGNSTLNGGPNGGSTLVGGSGTSTLIAGGGPESMWAGSSNSTLQGGSGPDTMGGNADVNSVTLMIGGTGNATFLGYGGTVTARGGSGNDTFWTGTGSMTITEGAGSDNVVFGAGHASITGGTGTDLYTFINGQAGGIDMISGFKAGQDQVQLFGYDNGTVQPQFVGGNAVLTLADNTSVTLLGVTHLAANSIVG
jgi:large repetitive protein